ncbi:hypothetical protein CCH79_00020219 [Gambusia affinis]|uniref:Sterile alpha motif domain-containing protein 9-like n=1 Tax=Gambusia affinis TaxID=33528 RepID=A0A315VQX6_GAMAF|nr:hypothetical protein CCH79_00020219 [Gambusia affinis]
MLQFNPSANDRDVSFGSRTKNPTAVELNLVPATRCNSVELQAAGLNGRRRMWPTFSKCHSVPGKRSWFPSADFSHFLLACFVNCIALKWCSKRQSVSSFHVDQFEEETIDQETAEQAEEKFLRGAPPEWLNFHISDLAESNGTGSSLIKRDGYKRLVQQIHKRKNYIGTPTVKLLHQQGCGGTTLAMQLLWDMRKTLRSAVLMGSPLECTKIAKEVVHLFTGGGKDDLNTVLLLINEEFVLEHLQDSIMTEIEEQQIDVDIPVVILFICVRSDHAVLKAEHYREQEGFMKGHDTDYVLLKRTLSDTEKEELNTKKEELSQKYGAKASQFHGFNILHSNFSQDYIQEACAVLNTVERKRKPLKTQLLSFLSLLNAYVPGSYLLESDCSDFLKHDHSLQGVARSDTARDFLLRFCPDEVSPCLLGFIKDLLTKREHKKDGSIEDSDMEKFSTLILNINEVEDKNQSASVLKVASKKFDKNSLFPQALARLYYGELEDFKEAEFWAKKAIERDPKKSFIADTLGQVHKNHLRNKRLSIEPRELLQLAQKAIEAFEHEEKLAEEEHRKSLTEDEKSKVLWGLNTTGQFGFLQVCNILFDLLVIQNETWKEVLTKNVPMGSVLESLGDNKLFSLKRFVHRRVLEILWTKDALQESNTNWKNESIFRDSIVEERLLKVEGVVRNYRVYARFRGTEVEVDANRRDCLCRSGHVSFYLGFTIKGPVAFSIRRKLLVTDGFHAVPTEEMI